MSTESPVQPSSSFTDLFIRRPVIAIVVNLIIIIAGVQAIRTLNVRQYPRSENATITVTTVYVGASADLVRGFITTPLERVIAVGRRDRLRRIHQHPGPVDDQRPAPAELRLDQGAGGDQLQGRSGPQRPAARGPGSGHQHPERRQPVRLRLPQLLLQVPPAERDHRLPRAGGAAPAHRGGGRAEGGHPRRPDLRHADLAEAGPDGRAQRQPGADPPGAGSTTTTWPRWAPTKGALVQVNLTTNTDLRSVDEFKKLIIKQSGGAVVRLSDVADVVLGAEDYDTAVRLHRGDRGLHRHLVAPQRQLPRRDQEDPGGAGSDPEGAPRADHRHHGVRRDRVHPERDRRRDPHLARHAAHRGRRHLPLPGLVPIGAGAGGGHPGLADRRGVPDAGFWLYAEPPHPAGHRPLRRSRGRRRDRGGGERRATPLRRKDAAPGGADRRPGAGRADHRHDHHPGGGVRAHRLPGRPHRLALPRVRAHPRRRGHHLRGGGADALADDVPLPAPRGRRARGVRRDRSTAASTASARPTPAGSSWRSPARPSSTPPGACSPCSPS